MDRAIAQVVVNIALPDAVVFEVSLDNGFLEIGYVTRDKQVS